MCHLVEGGYALEQNEERGGEQSVLHGRKINVKIINEDQDKTDRDYKLKLQFQS